LDKTFTLNLNSYDFWQKFINNFTELAEDSYAKLRNFTNEFLPLEKYKNIDKINLIRVYTTELLRTKKLKNAVELLKPSLSFLFNYIFTVQKRITKDEFIKELIQYIDDYDTFGDLCSPSMQKQQQQNDEDVKIFITGVFIVMINLIMNNNINKKYYTLVNNIKYYITKRCKNPYLTRTVTLTSKELSTQDKIDIVQELIYYSNIIQGEEKIEDEINTQQVIFEILDSLLTALRNEKLVEEEKSIAQARIEERNKIIADLSHYVKNMISSVIDPLENLKSETEIKPIIIQNALRGANLIREIVNAMNLSFKGSIDDFYYDAVHNTGKEKLDFKTIFYKNISLI